MKVILSIKPQFVEKIFNGTKKYEFRRSLFKNPEVNRVIIYASSPISKVVGEFDIAEILYDDISELWNETKNHSGISESFYLSYFSGKNRGYAIKIKETRKYDTQYSIKDKFGITPPQSFAYIK